MKVTHIALIGSILIAHSCSDAKPLTEAEVTQIAAVIGSEVGVEPALLVAIAKVESGYNPKAIGSSHGEVGLFQLHPKYFPLASFNPKANMRRAAVHLKKLKRACNKYGEAWFVCYNVGSNRTLKHPKLHTYYKKVQREYGRLTQTPTRQLVQNTDKWR